ncbi:MAG: ATP-dependent helicase [Sterolibacterium sp.]
MTISNQQYQEIITTKSKRVEVLACPGSGKTHTLIQRVRHLIQTGVPPSKILVLSFSNASVGELKRRMNFPTSGEVTDQLCSVELALARVKVSTAHSFALGLLPQSKRGFKPMTDKQSKTLLLTVARKMANGITRQKLWADKSRRILERRQEQLRELSWEKHRLVPGLFDLAQAAQIKLADAIEQRYPTLKGYLNVLLEVRRRLVKEKAKRGLRGYGDMLAEAGKLIDAGKATLPYQHVLVDEYQDCSPAQVQLLTKLIGATDCSVMVLGDANQAIFAFAGATYTPLGDVLDNVVQLPLSVSRRLTKQTAALASAVAQHSAKQSIRAMHDGPEPILMLNSSLKAQANRVTKDIRQLMAEGVPAQQIAVLARHKATLKPIEQSLLAHHVQTARIGIKRKRVHAQRVLKMVRLIEFSETREKPVGVSMLRAKLSKLEGIQEQGWLKAVQVINREKIPPSLEGRYRFCAQEYLRLLGGIRNNKEIRDDLNRWESTCREHKNARAMLNAIRSIEPAKIVTGTIHAAKGREWAHVFIVGVTEGLLPDFRARDEVSLSEERNLLFVAITRAQESVSLYHGPAAHSKSRQRFSELSRFLDDPAVQASLAVRKQIKKQSPS